MENNQGISDNVIYSNNEDLNDYAKLLKENGIDILVPEKPSSWYYITKDDKMAYIQFDTLYNISLCSVHKPTKTGMGSGYLVEKTGEPTVDMALKAMNAIKPIKPIWDDPRVMPDKYNTLEEFLQKESKLMLC